MESLSGETVEKLIDIPEIPQVCCGVRQTRSSSGTCSRRRAARGRVEDTPVVAQRLVPQVPVNLVNSSQTPTLESAGPYKDKQELGHEFVLSTRKGASLKDRQLNRQRQVLRQVSKETEKRRTGRDKD